jgi:hypothetical protein
MVRSGSDRPATGPIGPHRDAGLVRHPDNAKTFLAARSGLEPKSDAAQKVFTFEPQWLTLLQEHDERLGAHRRGLICCQTHLMRVQKQLALPWLAVIEHEHAARADHREPVLLNRVKPTD